MQSTSTQATSLTSSSSLQSVPQVLPTGSHSAWPSDIAQNSQQAPAQPKGFKYPSSRFGSLRRSFTSNWFEKYSWLEYSILKDAAFCFPCRFLLYQAKVEEKRLSFLLVTGIESMQLAEVGFWKSMTTVTYIIKQ